MKVSCHRDFAWAPTAILGAARWPTCPPSAIGRVCRSRTVRTGSAADCHEVVREVRLELLGCPSQAAQADGCPRVAGWSEPLPVRGGSRTRMGADVNFPPHRLERPVQIDVDQQRRVGFDALGDEVFCVLIAASQKHEIIARPRMPLRYKGETSGAPFDVAFTQLGAPNPPFCQTAPCSFALGGRCKSGYCRTFRGTLPKSVQPIYGVRSLCRTPIPTRDCSEISRERICDDRGLIIMQLSSVGFSRREPMELLVLARVIATIHLYQWRTRYVRLGIIIFDHCANCRCPRVWWHRGIIDRDCENHILRSHCAVRNFSGGSAREWALPDHPVISV
jgi:hypothetical protein